MRRKLFVPLPGFAFALAAWVGFAAAGEGLVVNSSFERGEGNALDGWRLDNRTPVTTEGVVSADAVKVRWGAPGSGRAGGRALQMELVGKRDYHFGIVTAPPLTVLPGFPYRISLWLRTRGMQPESQDRKQYTHFFMDLFKESRTKGHQGIATRIMMGSDSGEWLEEHRDFTTDAATDFVQIRLQLRNRYPDAEAAADIDDVRIEPLDFTLSNPGFETAGADEGAPADWTPTGSGAKTWVEDPVRDGRRAVAVADAGTGAFSGWSREVPVRADRRYVWGGFVKGGDLNPDGFIGGGAFHLQFLDRDRQALGEEIVSPAVGAHTDWTRVATEPATPPFGACFARLTAGLRFCRGTAWFDEVFLESEAADAVDAVRIQRVPRPDRLYAENLLVNGEVETADAEGRPVGWTYFGKAEPDWTPEEIEALHLHGRPNFNVGRGRGEYHRGSNVYAGKGALLNISIDPPKSMRHQWYGRNPVDGFWLSEPVAVEPGASYLASAWIKPGVTIGGESAPWFGPLEIRFYDADGKPLGPKQSVRGSLGRIPAGVWSWWPTVPHIAPDNAATARLRFGQELLATEGGWGRTFADNFALWKLPADAPAFASHMFLDNDRFTDWFRLAHATLRPPYNPAPSDASAYDSVWARIENTVAGNVFEDPDAPVTLRASVYNHLGESRRLGMRVVRYDARGQASEPIRVDPLDFAGFTERAVDMTLPASGSYGAFYLDGEVLEGDVPVGSVSGRYAVVPPRVRALEPDAPWGVTPLAALTWGDHDYDHEVGQLLERAGFRYAWVRMSFGQDDAVVDAAIAETGKVLAFYQRYGLRPIVQLSPQWKRPAVAENFARAGARIGAAFKGRVAAYGNHGIEQANSASPFRGSGEGRMTDLEYDTILGGLYDGIKSADADIPVLVGNIATDFEAKTLRRLYGAPANGRFDGMILNAYMGLATVAAAQVKAFDEHGDTGHTIWQEETANQRSPFEGPARREREYDGARNMVRSWIELVFKNYPRVKVSTMWGFTTNIPSDIMMVTPRLQPRPQYAAQAVMSDQLAGTKFVADRSAGNLSLFEWERGDETLLVAWANAGVADLTLEVPAGRLAVTDVLGNRTEIPAVAGLATVLLSGDPQYIAGVRELAVSRRLTATLGHGSTQAGAAPSVKLTLTNNDDAPVAGTILITGTGLGDGADFPFALAARATETFTAPVAGVEALDPGKRAAYRAIARTEAGAVYAASATLNFAQAVRAERPPSLDGAWTDWSAATPVPFGLSPDQIVKPGVADEVYEGRNDILGTIRLLWDAEHLYLGVEVRDDVFMPQPERNLGGFMGDSIEWGIQPDNLQAGDATYYEFEAYLPNGEAPIRINRRFPLPTGEVTGWRATATPTGARGDLNYQIAVPWSALGLEKAPEAGKAISLAVVLNDSDVKDRLSGGRGRIKWFDGVDGAKSPVEFGDVVLVDPKQ